MPHGNCYYFCYPLDAGGDATTDKDLHSPFKSAPEEEPAEEDPGRRPHLQDDHIERRHRPWPYYQC